MLVGDTRRASWMLVSLLLSVAWAGCQTQTTSSQTADADTETCVEGRTVSCPCRDGGNGIQVCQSDGTWGACDCETPANPDVDSGQPEDTNDQSEDTSDRPEETGPSGSDTDVVSNSDTRSDDSDASETREPNPLVPAPPIETRFGAKERHVADLPDEGVVDVTKAPYNAPTDGNSDAHPAIIQAIDDHAGSGNTIYLPAGDYRIDDTIVVEASDAPIVLKGDGSHTRIWVHQKGYNGIDVGDYRSENRVQGVVVRDMFVHKTAGADDNENGVALPNTFVDNNHGEVRNVWIDGFVGPRGGGLRVGMDGDSVVKHVTVSNSGSHGVGIPNYDPDDRVTVESVLSFDNGFHSGKGYGIDGDGILVEDAVSFHNGNGGKSSPDSPPANGPTTTWRNVWFIENEGVGFQITETVTNGLELDGVYALDNQSIGVRLTDKVDEQFSGDIRAKGNGRNGEAGNLLARSSRLDFERIEACDAKGGPGMWVSSGAGGRIGTFVHSGNAQGGLTGSPENLEIGNTVEGDCSVPSVPK